MSQDRPRPRAPRLALALAVILVLALVAGTVATSAEPESGRISLQSGESQVGWNGKHFPVGASIDRAICDVPEQCDEFELNVDIPAEHWDSHRGGVEVVISMDEEGDDDFDLYVLDSEGNEVGSSANGGQVGERVMIPNASGTYTVVVNPWRVTDAGYKGGAILQSRAEVGPGAGDVPTEPVSDIPCVDGRAGVFPCENVDLQSLLPPAYLNDGEETDTLGDPVHLNDIWGWTDPETGREYALVGKTTGTAFVDVTNPTEPQYLGSLPTAQPVTETIFKSWRDIKVYEDHAFIGSEEPLHGMQVFDLTRLRGVTEPQEWDTDAHYRLFGNSHNLAINEESGFLYAIGTSTCEGGPHVVDIRDPKSPSPAGCVFQDGYTHDTQCVNYDGPDERYAGREICFNSNEDTLTIVDVTDKLNPVQLSRTPYDGASYTHQGWLTEDGRSFLVNDELDEQDTGAPTTTRIFNVEKLDNPQLRGAYEAEVESIDHNLYTVGDTVFEANYRSGLRILDGSRANEGVLSETAFFDVFPQDDAPEFNGAWSNYPYFESGNVIVSGIEQGLFVLRPNTGGEELPAEEEPTPPGKGKGKGKPDKPPRGKPAK